MLWVRAALLVSMFLATLAPGAARAQDASTDLPVGTRLMVRTADGKFIEARLVASREDSLVLLKGDRRLALPTADVQGVWTFRRDAIGGLKAGAGFGALVGLLDGFAIPNECLDCDRQRGAAGVVLGKVVVNAGFYGLIGLLFGHFDGAWDARPGFAGSPATTSGGPFPLWSLSASLGGTHTLDGTETNVSAAIAGYRNSRPGSSLGFEFGVLEFPERSESSYQVFRYVPGDSGTIVVDSTSSYTSDTAYESSWAYATLFVTRMRGTHGSFRSQFLFGPAVYARWAVGTGTYRDSTGAIINSYDGDSVRSSFGLMGGFGATFGEGALRPALRARGHWIFSGSENFAATLEAGLDFH